MLVEYIQPIAMIKYISVFIIQYLLLSVFVQAQINKKVLVENISGTWCGLCPEADVILSQINNNENIINVSLHVEDQLEIEETADIGDEYTGGGVPAFLIDRHKFDNNIVVSYGLESENVVAAVNERLNEVPKIAVRFREVKLVNNNQHLRVALEAELLENYGNNDLRFNLMIVQKELGGYPQSNFFDHIDGHPYQGTGNPIQNYVHKNVVLDMLGGAWGSYGSFVGNQLQKGDKFYYNYEFVIPNNWGWDNIELIAMVQQYNEAETNRNILNLEKINMQNALQINWDADNTNNSDTAMVSILQPNENAQSRATLLVNVFPNPSSDGIKVQLLNWPSQTIYVSLVSDSGQKILDKKTFLLQSPNELVDLNGSVSDVQAGLYLLKIENEQTNIVKKVIIK